LIITNFNGFSRRRGEHAKSLSRSTTVKQKGARVFSVSVSRLSTTDLTSPPAGDKNINSDGARAYAEKLHPGMFPVDHTGLKKLIRTIPTEL
jgi:hypothetical protein